MSASNTRAITILGGGPAELATAFYAHRKGIPVRLFEKSSVLGGLCRTLHCDRHSYDSGAHRFHNQDPEITQDLQQLLPRELIKVTAPSQVYVRQRFLDFPPTLLNLLRTAGPALFCRAGLDLIRARCHNRLIGSFADFAKRNFGQTLADLFLLNYSQKLWGLSAEQLSADVATRRLSGMTLSTLLTELFFPLRRGSHIDGSFLYPADGYGQIIEALAGTLPEQCIRTKHEVSQLRVDERRIVEIRFSGIAESWRPEGWVASTLPLTLLVKLLMPPPHRDILEAGQRVRFRHILLLFMRLRRSRFSPNASIYIPDPSVCVSRIHEPKNRSERMAPPHETSIVAEVPCFSGDRLHQLSQEELFQKVCCQLAEIGLLNPEEVLQWRCHVLPNAYPVYSLGYAAEVQRILEGFQSIHNLQILGRNGLFLYSHLHDQMRFAKDFVESLVQERPPALL